MMKKLLSMASIAMVATVISCQTDDGLVSKNEVSQDALNSISRLGFSTQDVQAVDGGYLVEGDIMLHNHDLSGGHDAKYLVIAEVEQYRTTNLVSGTRTIKVSLAGDLPSSYVAALDEA